MHKHAILLTGATGYIASHTWLEAARRGLRGRRATTTSPTARPGCSTASEELSGGQGLDFERASVCDAAAMASLFARRRIDAVVHFAAFKAVGESVEQPLRYYANNIGGLMTLSARAMRAHGVRPHRGLQLQRHGLRQASMRCRSAAGRVPTRATNPYGETKLMGEKHPGRHGRRRSVVAGRHHCATSIRSVRTASVAASARIARRRPS